MNYTKIMFLNYQDVNRKNLELLNLVQDKRIYISLLNKTYLSSNKQLKLSNFITYTARGWNSYFGKSKIQPHTRKTLYELDHRLISITILVYKNSTSN